MSKPAFKPSLHAAGNHTRTKQPHRHRARSTRRGASNVPMHQQPRAFCSKRTVAALYFPAPTAATSLHYLRRAIKGDPLLSEELQKVGYRPRLRYVTARQQRILAFYLG